MLKKDLESVIEKSLLSEIDTRCKFIKSIDKCSPNDWDDFGLGSVEVCDKLYEIISNDSSLKERHIKDVIKLLNVDTNTPLRPKSPIEIFEETKAKADLPWYEDSKNPTKITSKPKLMPPLNSSKLLPFDKVSLGILPVSKAFGIQANCIGEGEISIDKIYSIYYHTEKPFTVSTRFGYIPDLQEFMANKSNSLEELTNTAKKYPYLRILLIYRPCKNILKYLNDSVLNMVDFLKSKPIFNSEIRYKALYLLWALAQEKLLIQEWQTWVEEHLTTEGTVLPYLSLIMPAPSTILEEFKKARKVYVESLHPDKYKEEILKKFSETGEATITQCLIPCKIAPKNQSTCRFCANLETYRFSSSYEKGITIEQTRILVNVLNKIVNKEEFCDAVLIGNFTPRMLDHLCLYLTRYYRQKVTKTFVDNIFEDKDKSFMADPILICSVSKNLSSKQRDFFDSQTLPRKQAGLLTIVVEVV